MGSMATLVERLSEIMRTCEWQHADLVRVSGQSSSVVSQWLGKGSKEIKTIGRLSAVLRMSEASGYAPLWIAEGTGPKRLPPRASEHVAAEPAPLYMSTEQKLAAMRSLLAEVPPDMREAFADVVGGWVRSGGADDRARALIALMAAPQKRQA